ncbi:MAG: alpha/beta fold hydrolase, partial [Pseudomonadota bacterium]
MARVFRRFVEGRYGQMHLRLTEPAPARRTPLVCLHMSPKSGRCFAKLMGAMGEDRVMVAPDYPGYGESDLPPETPPVRIEDYAACVWEAVDALGLGEVDLLGYHTGSKVAVEMAGQRGGSVRKILLISASVFTPDELEQIKAYFEPIPLDEDGTRFKTMWSRVVEYRGPGMTLEMMANKRRPPRRRRLSQ